MNLEKQCNLIQVQPLGGFDQPLIYFTDSKTRSSLQLGSLVTIPLGKRKIAGIVWSFEVRDKSNDFEIKKISSVIQQIPVITEDLMNLASWISKYYSCSKEACLEAMIPAPIREGMQAKSRRLISLNPHYKEKDPISKRATAQLKVIKLLSEKNKAIGATELIKLTSTSPSTITSLIKKGLII